MTKEKNTRLSRRQQLAVLGRVLGYMVRHYKFSCLVVVVCILGTALATLAGTLFMQSLIDDYILPLTQAAQPDFGPLAAALGRLAAVYVLGILCAYGYNRIMVNVSQGTMRNLRQELFQHMESLPLRYFDTHAHGDIMSVYTNDVDTLRQLISQGIPQIINSLLSLALPWWPCSSSAFPCPCSWWPSWWGWFWSLASSPRRPPTISRPSSRTWAW